jgi:DNA-binding transcriptional MerR regulator
MFIQELSRLTGVTAKAIRYYESIGLMPPPQRADNNYRVYTSAAVERLRFIVAARALDFSLAEIGELLEARDRNVLRCQSVLDSLAGRIAEIDRRIADLLALRESLAEIRHEARNLPPDGKCNEQCVCYHLTVNRDTGHISIHQENRPMNEPQPIVCDLTVFPASVREQIAATIPDMFRAVEAVQALPDGYAFRFPNKPGQFMTLAQFVEHERQCCPFYHFVLEVEPNGGPLWLRMTGGEGVKQFMDTAWRDLQGAVQQQLIQIGPDHDLNEVIAEAAPVLAEMLAKATPLPKDDDE